MYPKENTKFKPFLKTVFRNHSNLKEDIIDSVLLSPKGLELFNTAFTHTTADNVNNYESLEFLGDTTLNKAIAWYLSKRFPQLNCQAGVKIITRLKINLISKKSFAGFAKQLGFWEYVYLDDDTRQTKMEKVCEDVFEAFFGATELILDDHYHVGVGYTFCHNIIAHLLDSENISLKYEDLFDTKTRLKELFDYFGYNIGVLKYTSEKIDRIFKVQVFRVVQKLDEAEEIDIHLTGTTGQGSASNTSTGLETIGTLLGIDNIGSIRNVKVTKKPRTEEIFIGKGSASLKQNAEQFAARDALINLKKAGFFKELPEAYMRFCNP
jgi:dsRNA-specific ribonuclease